MQTKSLSKADAMALAQRAEDHFYDRKAAAIKGAKLQKVAVAFANSDGGEVYIGIADDKDEVLRLVQNTLPPGANWDGRDD